MAFERIMPQTGIPLNPLLTPTLPKFSELEARRVVFPEAARSVDNRSVVSL